MARISRRPAQQVIGKSFYEIFPDARGTRLPGVIEDSFKVGSSSILTHTLNALLPLQGEGGEPILHNIVVRPVSSVHTNYCLLQITDVTVAVTRERVLRERQNARYHAIVDSAPDAIITIDNDRNIQWVNGAVDHVLGYGHSELLGQKLDILLQPDNPLFPALAESFGAGCDHHDRQQPQYPMGQRRGGSCPGLWTLRVAGQKLDILLQPDNPLFPALAESSVDQKSDAAIYSSARTGPSARAPQRGGWSRRRGSQPRGRGRTPAGRRCARRRSPRTRRP